MRIGVPKEIKPNENRVAITPSGVKALKAHGHSVVIEAGAGQGSQISDTDYTNAGAIIQLEAATVWEQADMIIKVKEPLASEYDHFRENLVLFTYLHLAAEPGLTRVLMERKVTAVGYETVQPMNGTLPLLSPMSEVAGRMAPQIGASLLTSHAGGSGILLGGVPGVRAAEVVILGGGTVGAHAAKIAAGLGAHVTILDINNERLSYLDDIFGSRVQTLASNEDNIAESVKKANLLIGAVLIPGARAPKLVSEDMIRTMRPGSVIVDVAIDQGGSIATCNRTTTHANPVFETHGVLHYAVPNMPGAVPHTSTYALTNVTLPYALQLADKGWRDACRDDLALSRGINCAHGACANHGVADAVGVAFTPIDTVLS